MLGKVEQFRHEPFMALGCATFETEISCRRVDCENLFAIEKGYESIVVTHVEDQGFRSQWLVQGKGVTQECHGCPGG